LLILLSSNCHLLTTNYGEVSERLGSGIRQTALPYAQNQETEACFSAEKQPRRGQEIFVVTKIFVT
jgi:hypothetical protein